MKIKLWNFNICNFANLWHPADTFRLIILVIFIICSWNHSKKKSNTVIFYFNKAFFLDSQSHTNFYQSTWATANEFIIWYYLILKQLWVVYGTLSFYNWKADTFWYSSCNNHRGWNIRLQKHQKRFQHTVKNLILLQK